jgi:hypothetical protein
MAPYPGKPQSLDADLEDRHSGDRPTEYSQPLPSASAESILARVDRFLAAHHRGPDGWCAGCLEQDVLRFHPCSPALWAAAVHEEYGVAPTDRQAGRR